MIGSRNVRHRNHTSALNGQITLEQNTFNRALRWKSFLQLLFVVISGTTKSSFFGTGSQFLFGHQMRKQPKNLCQFIRGSQFAESY